MIAIDSIKKVNTSVVFVASDAGLGVGTPGLLLGVDLRGLGQIFDAFEQRQSPDGLSISSMRNQLIMTVAPNRIQFDDQSSEEPVRNDFPARVVRAAELIRRLSSQTYAAVGLNFDIQANASGGQLPSNAILSRFMKGNLLQTTQYVATGAAARLWYAAGNIQYDLRVEPIENQYEGTDFYAHLNVHIALGPETPNPDWVMQALHTEFDAFKAVLAWIFRP